MSEASRPDQPAPPSAVDRRASIRYLCDLATSCTSSDSDIDISWPAHVHDISTDGLGLVLAQSFEPDTLLGIELNNPDADMAYTISAKVVHSRKLADGTFRVGCTFLRKLSADEVQSLL